MTNFHVRSTLATTLLAAVTLAALTLAGAAQTSTTPGAEAPPAMAQPGTITPGAATGETGKNGQTAVGEAGTTLTGEGAGTVRYPTGEDEAASVTRADYPTTAIADYVFACMATNGETSTAMRQCACSFDVVASIIPHERYVEASTWLSMGQVSGEKGSIFRESAEAKASIGDLRRAQAEAEIRCFE